jgi:ribosomal protein S18 acetylase RimI-like enzyme
MNENVIMTSSSALPIPDANHACLLRAGPDDIEPLIDHVIDHFGSRAIQATVYVSDACTPPDLSERLIKRGFVTEGPREAWMVLEALDSIELSPGPPSIQVRETSSSELLTMAEVFMASFGMPTQFAPVMAQLLGPALDLPTVHHYIAWLGDQPVGVCSLHQHERYGVLGSAGVLPAYRRKGAATALTTTALLDALHAGVDTVILQTDAGTPLERLLRISGFSTLFYRTAYTES